MGEGYESLTQNPPCRMFHEYLAKMTAWHDSAVSSHVLLTCLFAGSFLASQLRNALIFR